MTLASQTFFDTMGHLLPQFAMLSVCVLAALRLVALGQRRHWPVYSIAAVTGLAVVVKLAEPCWWTQRVYIGFEGVVAVLALFVAGTNFAGRIKHDGPDIVLFGDWPRAAFFVWTLAAIPIALVAPCDAAYAWLGSADVAAVLALSRARAWGRIELLAQWGIGALLSFQALRLALFPWSEHAALAVGQAGWAVHCLAFFLIAHAARR